MLRKHVAELGFIFKSKNNGQLLGRTIYLGKEDNIDNYIQVLEVLEADNKEE